MRIPSNLPLLHLPGTTVGIHLLMVLVLGWFGLLHAAGEPSAILALLAFVVALVIHEVGHLLVAWRLKIGVNGTIIYPFGGIPVFDTPPPPRKLALYRLGGPGLNLFTALGLGIIGGDVSIFSSVWGEFLELLNRSCLILGGLGVLPLPPLDGADTFRSINKDATHKPDRAGGWQASLLACVALTVTGIWVGDPLPIAAAVAVGGAALRREAHARTKAVIGDRAVATAMTKVENLPRLNHGSTVTAIVDEVLRSHHGVFRVCHNGETLGFLFREAVIDAAIRGEDIYVSELIERDLASIPPTLGIDKVLDLSAQGGADPLIIAAEGNIEGIVFREQLLEFILVQHATGNTSATAGLE